MSDGFSYVDGATLGLVGVGMFGIQTGLYQMTDYQRQQLNYFRRIDNLPPIAPSPYPINFMWWAICVGARFYACAVFAALLMAHVAESPLMLVPGIALFAWLTHRAGQRRQRDRIEQLQQWAAAGCP